MACLSGKGHGRIIILGHDFGVGGRDIFGSIAPNFICLELHEFVVTLQTYENVNCWLKTGPYIH